MAELEQKGMSPLTAALQLRGVPLGATLCPCPSYEEGFPLPPRAEVGHCVCCNRRVVVPGLAVQMKLTPACFPCLRAAFADAKHLAGVPH